MWIIRTGYLEETEYQVEKLAEAKTVVQTIMDLSNYMAGKVHITIEKAPVCQQEHEVNEDAVASPYEV